MTTLRAGILLRLAVWCAFALMPAAWMILTHDGPETLPECLARVYVEWEAQRDDAPPAAPPSEVNAE